MRKHSPEYLTDSESDAMRPYSAYRDSGVDCLGEVPAHWEVKRLGQIGNLFKGGGGTKDDAVPDGVPCVRYGDLYTHHEFFVRDAKSCVSEERAARYTAIRYGDVLFAGSGETIDEIGKSAVNLIHGPACCGGDVIVFRPHVQARAEFLGYAMDCAYAANQKARMGRGFTVMHIYRSELKHLYVALPPIPEQVAIVRFLDHVDRRIRRYVRARRKLIDLLQESRKVLITHAVINTRCLGAIVGTKSTRSQVFPRIPKNWALEKVGHLVRRVKRPIAVRPDAEYREIGIRSWGKGIFHKNPVQGAVLGEKSVFRIEPDDFVLNVVFAWEGAVAVASENETGMIASHRFPTFLSVPEVDVDWLLMVFQSEQGRRLMEVNSPGAAGRNKTLRITQFLAEEIPLPPIEEQKAIVVAFRNRERRLVDSIAGIRQVVHNLEEFRTALILAVVTGKLDVREAAARLPAVDALGAEDDVETFGVDATSESEGFDTAVEEVEA